jgi:phosphoribosylglycinamide formyltransferase 2
MAFTSRILLLGSGELGKEFVIAAKRLGAQVIACDAYPNAPAMQVADAAEIFSMLDGAALRTVIERHRPDLIVPEVEAIRTEVLADMEAEGFTIVPSARATAMTMNRDSIRELAAGDLGLRTSRFRFAESLEEVLDAARHTGLADALALGGAGAEVDVRLFGKPATRPWRRMAVALATGADTDAARRLANEAASRITIRYDAP